MQAQFWHERWRSGKVGFHQPTIAAALQRHWPRVDVPHGSTVFVPLCGKSRDMLWLRDRGYRVSGVELSEVAIESFFMEHGIPARRGHGPADAFEEYDAGGLRLLLGDFFRLTPRMLESCAAVYDRASLVSWAPEWQTRYVAHLTQLLAPGSQTLLMTCEYAQTEMAGPPFSVDFERVKHLYSASHQVQLLGREDILATEPKWQARGVTALHEACYRLTRL